MSDSPVVVTTNASPRMSLVIFFMFALHGMEEAGRAYYTRERREESLAIFFRNRA